MLLDGWYGKIIGAILGAIIGRGLFGAIVGLVLGHQFDVVNRRQRAAGRGSLDDDTATAGGVGRGRPRRTEARVLRSDVPGHGARRQERRARDRAGDRRRPRGDAAVLAAARPSGSARSNCFTAGKSPDFPLEATLRTAVPAGGRASRTCGACSCRSSSRRRSSATGSGARPRAVFARICRALRHLAARIRLARGHVAHARRRQRYGLRAGGSDGRCAGRRRRRALDRAAWPTPTRCWACRRVRRMPR